MTAIYIILGILGIALFLGLGYYLWSSSNEKYDYNIFNLGVIIRGVLAVGCIWMAMGMSDLGDGSSMVWIIASVILWLWTFLETAMRANIFIAIFSLVYQLLAVVFILNIINRVLKLFPSKN